MPLSYSYMSIRKIPTTVKRLKRGSRPAGVACACGTTIDTGEPSVRSSFQASALPTTMPISDPDHGETLEARQQAGRRRLRLRHDDRHRRTERQVELPSKRAADDDAELRSRPR